MLSRNDIIKLSAFLKEDFKDFFATKADIAGLEVKIDSIQTSVDGLAKNYKDNSEEITVLGHRMTKVESWAEKAGGKIGVELQH